MLKNKCVVLGVTGSIAAYKIASLASALKKQHCDVQVIMTKNAAQFITPVTFETLTGNKCLIDTFDRNFTFEVEHISVAKKADLVLVAPASANIIGKLAHGIADDMLTTTILACKCPKLLSPAMNTAMFENPVVQDNLSILKKYGWEVIEPASGYLACGDTGAGKMPEPEVLLSYIEQHLACEKDLLGRKCWSLPDLPRRHWIRSAILPTIPPERWDMPSPMPLHFAVQMSPWYLVPSPSLHRPL